MATKEKDDSRRGGLEAALKAVRDNVDGYKDHGLSPTSFCAGLMNIAFTGFLLGRAPEHYWLWQTVKCTILLGLSYQIKARKHQQLYFFDICWVFATFYSLGGISTLANFFWPGLLPIEQFPEWIPLAIFGLANGPLGWACVALGNALILHDAEHMSSLFIHISPAFVTWSVRWHCAAVSAAWPGTLLHLGCSSSASKVDFMTFFLASLRCYSAWWVFFTTWMIVFGRHHSPKFTGYDTVYLSTLRGNAAVRRALGIEATEVENVAPLVGNVLKYMIMHAGLCTLAISFSYLLYHSFLFHTAFCIMLLSMSCYNGSLRYYKMMTRYFEAHVEKLLKEA